MPKMQAVKRQKCSPYAPFLPWSELNDKCRQTEQHIKTLHITNNAKLHLIAMTTQEGAGSLSLKILKILQKEVLVTVC